MYNSTIQAGPAQSRYSSNHGSRLGHAIGSMPRGGSQLANAQSMQHMPLMGAHSALNNSIDALPRIMPHTESRNSLAMAGQNSLENLREVSPQKNNYFSSMIPTKVNPKSQLNTAKKPIMRPGYMDHQPYKNSKEIESPERHMTSLT